MRKYTSLAAIALVILALAAPAFAAGTDVFGHNLIVNGTAEAGMGSPDDGDPVAEIPGWTRTGAFNVVQYGASGGFPDATSPGPKERGKKFFAGGPDNDQSSATQTIDVTSGAAAIDGGKVKYVLSGFLGGFESQEDHAVLTAAFNDSSGATLATAKIGPVDAAARQNTTSLVYRQSAGLVPAKTRSIVVTITATRADGSYNDGEADNLSLVLSL